MAVQDNTNAITALGSALDSAASEADKSRIALESLNDAVLKGGAGFNGIVTEVEKFSKALTSVPGILGDIIGTLPIIGGLGTPFKMASEVLSVFITGLKDVATTYTSLVGTVDAVSGVHRKLERDLFSLGATFGGTFDEAKENVESYARVVNQVDTPDFGFVRPEQLTDAAQRAKELGLSMERLTDETGSTDSAWLQLATSIRHAQALGIETTRYMELLNNAIMTQGLEVEDAAEQMAMFKDISSTTGLAVDKVANSLQGAADNFALLGLKADFGRPFLEGFTRTLDDMGLGIDKALGLTSSLTKAFADLSTNYGLAYVTSQRGGLDFGAGQGVLGAGIGLQAKMLQAEKTGDQAALGRELAGAMRDTLTSFTGGQVVTVEQAAERPELQQAYYAQTQMLQQMYGLDSNTSARTLDLLSQLEEATSSGDQNLADSLAEQIADGTSVQNETVDSLEKIETVARAQLIGVIEQNRWLSDISRQIATGGADFAQVQITDAAKSAQSALESNQENVESLLSKLFGTAEEQKDAAKKLSDPGLWNQISNSVQGGGGQDLSGSLSKQMTGGASNLADKFRDGTGDMFDDFKIVIGSLSQTFDKLIDNLNTLMSPINADAVGNRNNASNFDDARKAMMTSEDRNRRDAQMAVRAERPDMMNAGGPRPPNNDELKITIMLEPGDDLNGVIKPTKVTTTSTIQRGNTAAYTTAASNRD